MEIAKTILDAAKAVETTSMTLEQVEEHIAGGVIRETMWRPFVKAFGTMWDLRYSWKEQKGFGTNAISFDSIRPKATVAGKVFNLWGSNLMGSVVVSREQLRGLTQEPGEDFPLFKWQQVEGINKLGEIRAKNEGINLLSSYYVIGGVISESLLEGCKYAVPFRALKEQALFLGLFNSKLPAGEKPRKNLREQEILDITSLDATGRQFMIGETSHVCPKEILLKDGFGQDPLKSNLTLMLLEVPAMRA